MADPNNSTYALGLDQEPVPQKDMGMGLPEVTTPRRSGDVGFSVGQALSAALLGGLSVGAKQDYVTPFLENQRRLEATRAQYVERANAARVLAQRPGMQEVFTQFGGGDFETGIDRFSALDTEVGLRILEQTQGSQQFDAMAEALAATNDQSDPGLAQALRDMKGRGYTDLGMINTVVSDRNTKKQMVLQEQQLELSRISTMFDVAGNFIANGYSMRDIMPFISNQLGVIKTDTGQQMLGIASTALEAQDMVRVQDQAANLVGESWSKMNAGITAEDADPRLLTEFKDRLSKSDRTTQTQNRIMAASQIEANAERKAQFLAQATHEQIATYEQLKAANFSVDVGQLVQSNPKLLEDTDKNLAAFGLDYIASLDAGVEQEKTEAARKQQVEAGLLALEGSGLLGPGRSAELVASLNAENIEVDPAQGGKLVLDADGRKALVDEFVNYSGLERFTQQQLVDLLTMLDGTFSDAMVDDLLGRLIEPSLRTTQESIEGKEISRALAEWSRTNPLWVKGFDGTMDEVASLIGKAKVGQVGTVEYSINAKQISNSANGFSALVQSGILTEDAIRDITRLAATGPTPALGSSLGAGSGMDLADVKESLDAKRRGLLRELVRFRQTYWNPEMRQRVAEAARRWAPGSKTGKGLRQVVELMDAPFFTSLSESGTQEDLTLDQKLELIATAEYENPFFGPATYSYTAPAPSQKVDPEQVDFDTLGDRFASISTNAWARLTGFNSNDETTLGASSRLVAGLRERLASATAFMQNLSPLGTVGSNYANRLNGGIKEGERLVEEAESRIQLARAIDTALRIAKSDNFGDKSRVFTSILGSDGSLVIDGEQYRALYEAQVDAEGAATVFSEYLEVRLKSDSTLTNAEIAQLGSDMAVQRKHMVQLAGNLEESIQDLPDEALPELWYHTFGYQPNWEVSRKDLIMATLFRSPYAP